MSSSSAVQNGQPSGRVWPNVAPYLIPPLAASVAIIPVFYGFVAKSAQQIGKPIPRMTIKEALKGGVQAAPTIGVIVGTQMIMQNAVEKALMENIGNNGKPSFTSMLVSSVIVGGISAPALAVFNGQTMGRTVTESLRSLSVKQTTAIVFRETSFLFSLIISGSVSEAMKRISGDNKAVEYSSAFVSGAIGSVIGHPADTALTLWQKGMKVECFRQSMRGAPMKALAVGGFSVFYKIAKDTFQSYSN
jgi:hypothetical protein